jgi:hypothetical protein
MILLGRLIVVLLELSLEVIVLDLEAADDVDGLGEFGLGDLAALDGLGDLRQEVL